MNSVFVRLVVSPGSEEEQRVQVGPMPAVPRAGEDIVNSDTGHAYEVRRVIWEIGGLSAHAQVTLEVLAHCPDCRRPVWGGAIQCRACLAEDLEGAPA